MKKFLLLAIALMTLFAVNVTAEGVNGPGVSDTILAAEMPGDSPQLSENSREKTFSQEVINIISETKLLSFLNIKTIDFYSFYVRNDNTLNIVSGFNCVIQEVLSLREA